MARGHFGELLKRERELREVTLAEITSATRIGSRFLQALENEDWDKLPGGVFNRGFVRSIARYLGLDEEAFLAEYDLAHGTQLPPPAEKQEERIPSPPRWLPFALIIGALVLLICLIYAGVLGWRYFRARHPRATAATLNDSGPVLLELHGQLIPSLGLPDSSGTIKLSRYHLRQADSGNSLPRSTG
jgi:cytoskeleton protein RodZ